MALRRQKHRDGIACNRPLVIAEERLGRTVEGEDPPSLVEHDDAVGCRVENGLELLDAAVPRRRRDLGSGGLSDDHQLRCRAIPFGDRGAHGDGNILASLGGKREGRILVAPVPECRRAAEKMHETALGSDPVDIAIAGQVEKEAVGEQNFLAAMDQNSDRQPVENSVIADRHEGRGSFRLPSRLGPIGGRGGIRFGDGGWRVFREAGTERARNFAKGTALRVGKARGRLLCHRGRFDRLRLGRDRIGQSFRDLVAQVAEPRILPARLAFRVLGLLHLLGRPERQRVVVDEALRDQVRGGMPRIVQRFGIIRRLLGRCPLPQGVHAQETEAPEADQFSVRAENRHSGPVHGHLHPRLIDAPENRPPASGRHVGKQSRHGAVRILHSRSGQLIPGQPDDVAGRGTDGLGEIRRDIREPSLGVRVPYEADRACLPECGLYRGVAPGLIEARGFDCLPQRPRA